MKTKDVNIISSRLIRVLMQNGNDMITSLAFVEFYGMKNER
jgi:hypothetical protein